MPEYYRLLCGPGSPYSLKVRAILRYRQLPHRWIVPRGYLGTEGELARVGKKIIPSDPGQAMLSHLIDDLADEVLVMAMFDMRWGSEEDLAFCARRQMSGWLSPMPASEFEPLVAKFIERQVANRATWVAADNHDILADFYRRLLTAMERLPETSSWLRNDLARVPEASLEWLRPLLQQRGCWEALQRDELDARFFQPMAPL